MQFNLSEAEIKHIVAKYITDAGLNPGEAHPNVTLAVTSGTKKSDPVTISANVDVAIDITIPFGGGGGIDVLAGKAPENKAAFAAGAQKPAEEKPATKKLAATRKTKPKEDPSADREEPKVTSKPTMEKESEPSAEAAPPANKLFGAAAAKTEVASVKKEAPAAAATPKLFGAKAQNPGVASETAAVPQEGNGILEEGDDLVEEGSEAAPVTGDTLFAPKAQE